MLRTPLLLSMTAVALATGLADAGPLGPPRVGAPLAATGDVVPVQYRDADVYYDENGSRVIVDSNTGEVIAVQPRYGREAEGRRERRQRRDRYHLDDPDDMARLRRERRGGFLRHDEAEADDYGYVDPVAPDDGYTPPRRNRNAFPEPPRDPDAVETAPQPRTRRREVERAPLPDQQATAADPAAKTPSPPTIETIIEEPASAAPAILKFTAREDVASIQVLMDRAGASPGVIDGKFGSNVDKALAAYNILTGQNLKSTDTAGIKAALAASGGDPFVDYTITPEDAAGPYVASVPTDYSEKAKLERMSYTSVPEMLGERFHMDEGYLRALNPEANFSRPGTIVKVAGIGAPVSAKVARITADKAQKQVLAYDAYDKLVAAYPATIGSADTPSPTGTHAVSRVAFDPNYTYNPKINFKQGENDKVLTIPPGPNGPVGSIWIALDKPTYGVHGTPDPSKIGKTESHGCVRLTNWDAQELAKIVSPGTTVEFLE